MKENITHKHGLKQWSLDELRQHLFNEISILEAGQRVNLESDETLHSPVYLAKTDTNNNNNNITESHREVSNSIPNYNNNDNTPDSSDQQDIAKTASAMHCTTYSQALLKTAIATVHSNAQVSCVSGFYGNLCRQKCNNTCESGLCDFNTGFCLHGCMTGWEGIFCEVIISTTTVSSSLSAVIIVIIVILSVLVIIFLATLVRVWRIRRRQWRYFFPGRKVKNDMQLDIETLINTQ
ncbi:unnamed protein product [Mytilus coruscus]|uniref:MEGF10_11 n=1 Tax=Mytilus coruscus TaxID=42192 RepID=A0A6J8AUY7_MYTCO|nr:unnamed protein product [Mytilus coruscus]